MGIRLTGLRGRVIVVEDDPLVLGLVSSMLTELGLAVTAVSTAEDALALLDAGVDLLMTDLNLGGMSGLELADAACARHPQLRVVIVSGDPERVSGYRCLQKPFKVADLERTIRDAIGGAAMPVPDESLTR